MSQYMEVVSTESLINDISSAVETQALSTKQDKLTAGSGISISEENVISATGGGSSYTAGANIDITSDVISVTGILPGESLTELTGYVADQYYDSVNEHSPASPTELAGSTYLVYENTEHDPVNKTFKFKGKNDTAGSACIFILDDMGEVNRILEETGTYSSLTTANVENIMPGYKVVFNFSDTTAITPEVYEYNKTGELLKYARNDIPDGQEQTMTGNLRLDGNISYSREINTGEMKASKLNAGSLGNATGYYSMVQGTRTEAGRKNQSAFGKCNIIESGTASTEGDLAFIVGNGSSNSNRSNAYTLDWQGNGWFSGTVFVGSTSGTNKDAGSKELATKEYVDSKIAEALQANH